MAKRSKKSAPPPTAAPLVLPQELTIYTAGELHPQWLAWLAQAGEAPAGGLSADTPAVVQAAVVDQVDAAGLQLLLSLQRALADRGRSLQIHAPSDALRSGCEALGMGEWLQAQTAQTSPAARSVEGAGA